MASASTGVSASTGLQCVCMLDFGSLYLVGCHSATPLNAPGGRVKLCINCELAILQEKEKWSKDKFEIANKAKAEAARLSSLENEAQDKAKYASSLSCTVQDLS